MSKTQSSTTPLPYALPVRKDYGNIEEVGRAAARLGGDVAAMARGRSGDEWVCDSSRAENMQDSFGLDNAQFLALLTALVGRNRSIWGAYCAASLTPWYADLIASVEAVSETNACDPR